MGCGKRTGRAPGDVLTETLQPCNARWMAVSHIATVDRISGVESMAEFSGIEIYILLNQPKPLWLSHID
jgi:hypothetical protein